jgi:uncharacterized protein (PEP-CTERM system associated)
MSSFCQSHLPRTLFATLTLAASMAGAQTVRVVPSLAITETLTSNVNLAPSSSAKSDLISSFAPAFSVSEQSARTRLTGDVSMPILIYARTGSGNDTVVPQVNLTGNIEALDKWLYIDGNASVSQQYASPFGPRPADVQNINQNRYTAQSYSISPYVKRALPGEMQIEIRDTNTWTKLNNAPTTDGTTAYTNVVYALVSRSPLPLGWETSYTRSEVKFGSQPLVTQLGRANLVYQADPELQLSLRTGYEDDDFGLTKVRSSIYGLGARWQPNQRTTVNGYWEHRFFGSSYQAGFTYRTTLLAWDASFSRDITTLPQQLAAGAGVLDTRTLLNQLFLAQFPDPIQRQQFIEQYIIEHGLSQFSPNPNALFTNQTYLTQQASTSIGLLGVRNAIFLTLFHVRTNAIVSTTDVAAISQVNDNTQLGGTLVWTHNLASNLSFVASGTAARTTGNGAQAGSTRQGTINLSLSSALGPKTSISAGARYFIVRSDLADDIHESAIFVTVSHVFR